MNDEAEQLELWKPEAEEVSLQDMDNAVIALRRAKDLYAEASATQKELYAAVKECESKVISLMKTAGKERYIAEGVGAITLTESMSVQTPKTPEEKEAFFNWLKKEMGEDGYLTYATVNSNSLNSLYKQKVEEYGEKGEVLEIDGLQAPTSYTKLSMRKA